MYSPNQIKEETLVIYQDREINFRIMDENSPSDIDTFNKLKHTDGLLRLKPGKKINVRLYSNQLPIKIDFNTLKEQNKQYLLGASPFIILENSGKFALGNVNYIAFECIEYENQVGISTLEVKIRINILQEQALGITSGLTDWAPNIYYEIGDDVIGPDKRLYNCIVSHVSGDKINRDNFERQGIFDQEDADELSEIIDEIKPPNIEIPPIDI